jgi:importin-4
MVQVLAWRNNGIAFFCFFHYLTCLLSLVPLLYSGENLIEHFSSILAMLHPVCIRECTLTGATDSGGADIDNAISAVCKMIRIDQSQMPLDLVLPVVLSALPIKADYSEGDTIFGTLCDMIDNDTFPVVAPLISNLLIVFSKTLVMPKISEEAKRRIVKSIYRLATGQSAQIFAASVQTVEQEHQSVLQQALNAHVPG